MSAKNARRQQARRPKRYKILGCLITTEENQRGQHRVIVALSTGRSFVSRWHPSLDGAMMQALRALDTSQNRARLARIVGPLMATTLTSKARNGG
jgi:hypothetical protein